MVNATPDEVSIEDVPVDFQRGSANARRKRLVIRVTGSSTWNVPTMVDTNIDIVENILGSTANGSVAYRGGSCVTISGSTLTFQDPEGAGTANYVIECTVRMR